jgi:hypothetical protein
MGWVVYYCNYRGAYGEMDVALVVIPAVRIVVGLVINQVSSARSKPTSSIIVGGNPLRRRRNATLFAARLARG